jgi:glycosyltransferase involved in cell wall biosynthesis
MQLSIALPCYNEEENIDQTIADVSTWFDTAGVEGEIVAVDDGSTDGTRETLVCLTTQVPEIRPSVVLRWSL